MTYSEYNNKIEYKITISKKKYFFRDAIKLYIEDNKIDDQSITGTKSSKINETILAVVKKIDFKLDRKKRILFDMTVITALATKVFLAKNSKLTSSIIEFYKKKGIISNRIMDLRDELLAAIQDTSNENHELYLFYYMRVFSIKNYSEEVFENFYRSNIYNLDGTVTLIYTLKHSDKYSSVEVVYFDQELNDALKKGFFNQSENVFEKIDHYFEKPFLHYEKHLNKFLKDMYTRITCNDLTYYSKPYFKNLIKQAIELDYQLDYTPVHHTLQKETLYPHTNYLELITLFPKITNKEYQNIEIENREKQRQHAIIKEDEIEQISIEDYLKLDLSAYNEFKKFKQYSKVTNKKEHDAYIARLDKFILKYKDTFKFPKIFYYVKNIVLSSRFNKESDEKLAVSTVYNKLCILFVHCFNIIIQEGRIDLDVQELIKNKIENIIKYDTKKKYYTIINPFLDLYGCAINYKSSKNIRYARRSLVFKKELDELYDVLIKTDEEYYNIDSGQEEKNKFISHQRFVFCMLLYYSGLRESEMWSRTIKDIYLDGNIIIIDINQNNLIKSFKTYSAKRRVEFTIDDIKYFTILKEYLQFLEHEDYRYLYPMVNKNKKIAKEDVQDLYFFIKCGNILKDITGRYVSLHSFRHTYVTKTIRALIQENKKGKNDFYNIVNMTGHLGPEVTLRYYSHIDYILHFRDIKKLF